MSKIKSPQDKKRVSYERDRRNDYGENAKSSRKNIPRSKAFARRRERHEQNQATRGIAGGTESDTLGAEIAATTPQKRWFRKFPDTPLGEYIKYRQRVRRG